MEAMTRSWTDERLEERFDLVDQRFDIVDLGGGAIVTFAVGFASLILTQL